MVPEAHGIQRKRCQLNVWKRAQLVKSWPLTVRNIKENFCVIQALSSQFSGTPPMSHLSLQLVLWPQVRFAWSWTFLVFRWLVLDKTCLKICCAIVKPWHQFVWWWCVWRLLWRDADMVLASSWHLLADVFILSPAHPLTQKPILSHSLKPAISSSLCPVFVPTDQGWCSWVISPAIANPYAC